MQHWRRVKFWREMLRRKAGFTHHRAGILAWRNHLARLLPNSLLHEQLRRVATHHNNNVYATFAINTGSAYDARKHTVPDSWYGPPTALTFEGRERPAPSHAHELLQRTYGDYLTPPPVEKRINRSHALRYFPAPPASP
jgi:hypothetical protein